MAQPQLLVAGEDRRGAAFGVGCQRAEGGKAAGQEKSQQENEPAAPASACTAGSCSLACQAASSSGARARPPAPQERARR